ncbi:MAG: RloB domain-containing protein [Bacteroidaceae bacterium]|nr:RloB domain-containing protein [Bacteroidaceae bacterium]
MARKIKIDNAILKRFEQKTRKQKASKKISCRILIVCEGEKTEPNYFKKFKLISNNSFTYEVHCEGCGEGTMKVVNTAIHLAKKTELSSQPYDSVWAVFDKDNFADFNAAIEKAENNNINVAWSNEAFELWYLYHFHNRTTRMSRNDYKKAISDAVNATGKWPKKQPYEYKKEDENNYNIMNTYGNIRNAIKWAKQQHQTFADKNYANQNPCTTVYKLALQLLNEDKDLIDAVMNKINSN